MIQVHHNNKFKFSALEQLWFSIEKSIFPNSNIYTVQKFEFQNFEFFFHFCHEFSATFYEFHHYHKVKFLTIKQMWFVVKKSQLLEIQIFTPCKSLNFVNYSVEFI